MGGKGARLMGTRTAKTEGDEALPQGSPVMLEALHPVNLLSFGPDTPEIRLGPLNVLIGPNGSGKSNLIEVVALLRSCAMDIADFVR